MEVLGSVIEAPALVLEFPGESVSRQWVALAEDLGWYYEGRASKGLRDQDQEFASHARATYGTSAAVGLRSMQSRDSRDLADEVHQTLAWEIQDLAAVSQQ